MRIEIILFLVTGFVVFNIYTEGRVLKRILAAKKYLQMAGIVCGALFLYYLIKLNPMRARDILQTSNEYVKYLPIDRNTTDFISPILDFTAKTTYRPVITQNSIPDQRGDNTVMGSGRKTTKRSVSETKKKFVASRQNWKCDHCKKQLSAWFEVDHVTRLEHGGSNHIDNLVALCRECHGEKTAIENL